MNKTDNNFYISLSYADCVKRNSALFSLISLPVQTDNLTFVSLDELNSLIIWLKNKCNKQLSAFILLNSHNGLIYKLMRSNMPRYLCKIIANFRNDRTFVVEINNIYIIFS